MPGWSIRSRRGLLSASLRVRSRARDDNMGRLNYGAFTSIFTPAHADVIARAARALVNAKVSPANIVSIPAIIRRRRYGQRAYWRAPLLEATYTPPPALAPAARGRPGNDRRVKGSPPIISKSVTPRRPDARPHISYALTHELISWRRHISPVTI